MANAELGHIVRGFFEDALNGRDVDRLDRYCSVDYVWHAAERDSDDVSGLAAFKELAAGYFRAFPDFETKVHDIIVGDDKVVARYVEGGTFTEEFFGFAPSGTKVFWPGIAIYRIENGKIAEEWSQTELELRVGAASAARNA